MGTREILVQEPLPQVFKIKKLGQREKIWSPAPEARRRSRMISVIIPAHNEERYLASTLEALRRQTFDSFEIIVVANGCTDLTANVARGRCHRLIVLSRKSLGVARNLGARMAKGELLLFLDADTLLDPNALQNVISEFSRAIAAGTVRGVPDVASLKYRLMYGLKNLVHRTSLHHGSSGVIVCWKKHFMQSGGFDEGLEVRENSELIRRLMRFGKYRYIQKVNATTSMRRYDQRGCGRMVWLWIKLWFQSLLGGDMHHRKYETVR